MNRITKKQTVFILVIILSILQLFFNKNNFLPKVSIGPTNIPTSICRGQACLTPPNKPYDKQIIKVVRVIDGDTIEIEEKIKVRYIGINSPEIYHDSTGKKTGEQCFAQEAYLKNKELVEGKTITLVRDVSDKDKYDRLLRYVYVDPSKSSEQTIFVNDYLITNGYAKIMTIKPDIQFSQQFKTAEKEAKEKNLGLWKCVD